MRSLPRTGTLAHVAHFISIHSLFWGPALHHHQAAFAMAHIHGMRDLLEQHLAADLLPGGVEPAAAPAQAAPVTCLLDTDTIGVVLTTLNRSGLVTAPVLDHTKVGDSQQRTYVVDTANMVGSIDMTIILQAFLRGTFFSSSNQHQILLCSYHVASCHQLDCTERGKARHL